jgi:hypothetical protein
MSWTFREWLNSLHNPTTARMNLAREGACWALDLPTDATDAHIDETRASIGRAIDSADTARAQRAMYVLQCQLDDATDQLAQARKDHEEAHALCLQMIAARDTAQDERDEARAASRSLALILHTLRGIVAFPDIDHAAEPELPPDERDTVQTVCDLLTEARRTSADMTHHRAEAIRELTEARANAIRPTDIIWRADRCGGSPTVGNTRIPAEDLGRAQDPADYGATREQHAAARAFVATIGISSEDTADLVEKIEAAIELTPPTLQARVTDVWYQVLNVIEKVKR